MEDKDRVKNNLQDAAYYIVLVLIAIIMGLPFYWMLITSVRVNEEILTIPVRWIPERFTIDHFVSAFTTVKFARYFANSLYLALVGVALNVFFGSLGGYTFAKLKFRGKSLIFKSLVASFMIPGVVIMIPQFIMLYKFPLFGGNNLLGEGGYGLLNSYAGVILPSVAGPFAVFLMRQFFLTLPNDLAESARIDGAGEFRTYWNIYLPLTKPALATVSIFSFQGFWNSFLWPMIVLNDPDKATIQMGLQAFSYNHTTDFGPMMAGSLIAVLPIVLIFIFAQKSFVRGISFSGIKG